VAIALNGADAVTVFYGNGNDTTQPIFSYYYGDPAGYYSVGDSPVALVATDFNRDLLPDLAVANYNADNVSVLINNYKPKAYSSKIKMLEDTTVPIKLQATIGPNDYKITQEPAHGTYTTTNSLVHTTVNPVLWYTPATNYFGLDAIKFYVDDGYKQSTIATIGITITNVNDKPVMTIATNVVDVLEDAGIVKIPDFIPTLFKGGSAQEFGESLQAIKYVFQVADTNLFSGTVGQPKIMAPGRTLQFTPKKNSFGSTLVTMRVVDNGGTKYGGVDTSDPATFTINIANVNDAPVVTPTILIGKYLKVNDSGTWSFTVSDVDSPLSSIVVGVESSDLGVVDPTKADQLTITKAAGGANWTILVRPAAPGKAIVTITISDGINSTTRTTSVTGR
jgi:hypothetical protein